MLGFRQADEDNSDDDHDSIPQYRESRRTRLLQFLRLKKPDESADNSTSLDQQQETTNSELSPGGTTGQTNASSEGSSTPNVGHSESEAEVGATETLGGAAEIPGGATETPGGAAETPGELAETPAGVVETLDGATETPGGVAETFVEAAGEQEDDDDAPLIPVAVKVIH